MNSRELQAIGTLSGNGIAGIAGLARDVHRAAATRAFGMSGPGATPARAIHDAISAGVYGSVRATLRAGPIGAATLAALRSSRNAPELTRSVRGNMALGALNGGIGDALAEERSALALEMTIRRHGRDIGREELADAFPAPTPRVVVFVHGLCETEDSWRLPPLGRSGPPDPSYGARLREEHGFTPVYVRYNTGLHISDNGRRLSELLDGLVDEWPVEVEELVLIGHSMGGLVARSAVHQGEAACAGWIPAVRSVFCLGSPHLGAPLEKAANVAGWALTRLPETAPFGGVVNRRSVGIKDLRYGSCAEEDWRDRDPDEFLKDRCGEVPFLESADYYFVGATLLPGRAGDALGDLLVRYGSASGAGRKRKIPFEVDNGCHLKGLSHFDLLNHPAVYERIERWIAASG